MRCLFGARDDVDGDRAAFRLVPEQVEQDETVDIAEAEIERDRARPQLADHCQRSRPGRGDHTLDPGVVRHVEQDAGKGRVALDDQHEGLVFEIVAVVLRAAVEGGFGRFFRGSGER